MAERKGDGCGAHAADGPRHHAHGAPEPSVGRAVQRGGHSPGPGGLDAALAGVGEAHV